MAYYILEQKLQAILKKSIIGVINDHCKKKKKNYIISSHTKLFQLNLFVTVAIHVLPIFLMNHGNFTRQLLTISFNGKS